MVPKIDLLIVKMRLLQNELENEYRKKRENFEFILKKKRIYFAREVARQQRRMKSGVIKYLLNASMLNILSSPIIYFGFVPMLMLDFFLFSYMYICFSIYGVPKVKRCDYFVFDRTDLPYLNIIEKFNCFYCSYGNGLAAYFREIAARTEQYWCPIKHSRRIIAAHDKYPRFFEYGDAESYRKGLEHLRNQLANNEEEK